jgi:hypothetical protein
MSRLSHRPNLTPITFALGDNICFLTEDKKKEGLLFLYFGDDLVQPGCDVLELLFR